MEKFVEFGLVNGTKKWTLSGNIDEKRWIVMMSYGYAALAGWLMRLVDWYEIKTENEMKKEMRTRGIGWYIHSDLDLDSDSGKARIKRWQKTTKKKK